MFQKIDQLISVEYTSRILLGALYRQYEFNPTEYIYNCLGAKITPLNKGDVEHDLIYDYCMNTSTEHNFKKINIFKIERKGEAERFESKKELGNRKLLFHGS